MWTGELPSKAAVIVLGLLLALGACAGSQGGAPGGRGGGGPRSGGGPSADGGRGSGPSAAMLAVCEDKSSGDTCTADGQNGSCYAPRSNLPLACVPEGGQRGPGGRGQTADRASGGPIKASSNSGAPLSETQAFTVGVLCNHSVDAINPQLQIASRANWSCVRGQRLLISNSVPMHPTGQFPNPGNPSRISAQSYSFTITTSPIVYGGPGGRAKEPGVALNGVKFDPGTAGRCADTVTDPSQCNLGRGDGRWAIEALGQDVFDFGEDENNAHVQPTGHYHYHGVPEGMLTEATKRGETMQLIGWAADGFPIYARYGYVEARSPLYGIKTMAPSYRLKSTPDPGRPSLRVIPMGAFTDDWEYVEGSGDLDECNGRFAATPEFPEGIYHYYATDTFPFIQRCVKGNVDSAPTIEQRGTGGRERGNRERRGRGEGGRRQRPGGGSQ